MRRFVYVEIYFERREDIFFIIIGEKEKILVGVCYLRWGWGIVYLLF